jgi:hypothetical protein
VSTIVLDALVARFRRGKAMEEVAALSGRGVDKSCELGWFEVNKEGRWDGFTFSARS